MIDVQRVGRVNKLQPVCSAHYFNLSPTKVCFLIEINATFPSLTRGVCHACKSSPFSPPSTMASLSEGFSRLNKLKLINLARLPLRDENGKRAKAKLRIQKIYISTTTFSKTVCVFLFQTTASRSISFLMLICINRSNGLSLSPRVHNIHCNCS